MTIDTMKTGESALKPLRINKIDWPVMKLSLLYTFIWGMLAHAYGFLNFTVSHDSLYEFIATYWQHLWKNSLGRIFVMPYHALFRGILTIPWLLGVLALVWIALSVYLVIRLFSVRSKTTMFFIAGVFAANLTVACNAATYIGDLDANMLALLTATAAAYLWSKPPRGFLLGIPLITLSLGLFQSYASVAIVLILFYCILWLLNGQSFKTVFLSGLKGVAMLLGGGGLYLLLLKAWDVLFGVSLTYGTPHSITNLWTQPLPEMIKLAFRAYPHWLNVFTRPITIFPATLVLIANGLLAAITVWLLAAAMWKRKLRLPETLLTAALLLLIPFAANITYVLDGGMSNVLMEYAFWLIYLLPMLLVALDVFKPDSETPRSRIKVLRFAGYAMIAVFLWGSVQTANSAYLKKDLERQATLSSMTRAMSDLHHQPEYVRNETPVAFYGFNTEFKTLESFTDLERINGLDLNSQITYDYHWAYIRYILNEDILLCQGEPYQAIEASAELAEMPYFQDEGYIRMIDGVMVVKMGP